MTTDTVTAYIAVSIVPSDLRLRSAAMTITHSASDPAAATMVFNLDDYDTKWIAALDLLAGAVETPNRIFGKGDLTVRRDGGVVRIFLSSPEGTATVQVGVEYLRAFVEQAVYNAGDVFEQAERYATQLDQEWLTMWCDAAEADMRATGTDPVEYLRDGDFDDDFGASGEW